MNGLFVLIAFLSTLMMAKAMMEMTDDEKRCITAFTVARNTLCGTEPENKTKECMEKATKTVEFLKMEMEMGGNETMAKLCDAEMKEEDRKMECESKKEKLAPFMEELDAVMMCMKPMDEETKA